MMHGRPITRVIRSLRSGQITIPAQFRRELGIEDDSLLQLTLSDGELRIRPVRISEQRASSGSPWLKQLYDYFEPVREEARAFSEQEIDQAIDQAVRVVRRSRD